LPILSNLDALAALRPARGAAPGLIGLDVSRRALGVAGADPGWQLATPLVTIRRARFAQDVERLQALLAERAAGVLALGWPLNMDGSVGPRCESVRGFARALDEALGLPMLFWDERLTTFAAEERADELGLRGRARAAQIDALAAAAMLQDLLNALQHRALRTNVTRNPHTD
jgi:putative Holliday junction resolvase